MEALEREKVDTDTYNQEFKQLTEQLQQQEKENSKLLKFYEGEIKMFEEGQAILQMVIMPVPKIEPEWSEELSDTVRGDGGFGHTNLK